MFTFSRLRYQSGALSLNRGAREVQGECRAELARAMLSRSLHSYSHLPECEYKVTKIFVDFQILHLRSSTYVNLCELMST